MCVRLYIFHLRKKWRLKEITFTIISIRLCGNYLFIFAVKIELWAKLRVFQVNKQTGQDLPGDKQNVCQCCSICQNKAELII